MRLALWLQTTAAKPPSRGRKTGVAFGDPWARGEAGHTPNERTAAITSSCADSVIDV
jgi:hypothetical protein